MEPLLMTVITSVMVIATKTVARVLVCLFISALYCSQSNIFCESTLTVVTSDLSASDIIFEQFALGLIALIAFHFPSGNINYKNNTLHSTNILSKKKQILGGVLGVC
jgi:uncharacterized membrane protein